jgi:hypothetical protein
MAVANITEFGNSINIPKVLSDLMSPALVKSVCMMNLMHVEDLPVRSMVKQFRKNGSLTAAALAESTALAIDSNGELTRTAVDATVAKCAISSGLSVEALKFSDLDAVQIAEEQASGIARFVDDDALGMFSGFSNTVTATSVLTIEDVLSAQFSIYNAKCPNKEIPLAVVVSERGHLNIKTQIVQSGAAMWSNDQFLSILKGTPASNCYVGSLGASLQFYATTGHATSGGDTVQGVFHPRWCLAGVFDVQPDVWMNKKGPEGLYQEVVSYYFYDIVEWNDGAGCGLLSDT